MPDQTVQVTFSPQAGFSFSPDSPPMTAAGMVILHRSPGDATWTFVSVEDLPAPQFSWRITGNGAGADISDGHTSVGKFHFGVTVLDGNTQYSSDDTTKQTVPPMIVNQ